MLGYPAYVERPTATKHLHTGMIPQGSDQWLLEAINALFYSIYMATKLTSHQISAKTQLPTFICSNPQLQHHPGPHHAQALLTPKLTQERPNNAPTIPLSASLTLPVFHPSAPPSSHARPLLAHPLHALPHHAQRSTSLCGPLVRLG